MTGALPAAELDRLADAVCGRDVTRAAGDRAAIRTLYKLLAEGRPLAPGRFGAAVGWDEGRAEAFLAALPNVERTGDGAVVGFGGLSLRPTPHRITLGGGERFTWCAWDTLFLPVALGVVADVATSCPETGRPITLRVAPDRVLERDPDGVVCAFVHPDGIDDADLRGSFCSAVHFLVDTSAAARWAAGTDDRLVLELDDAFELGRRMITERCGLG